MDIAEQTRTWAFLASLALAAACAGDASSGVTPLPAGSAPPTVASANVAVAAIVGTALDFDATKSGTVFSNPGGGALTYGVAFSGSANGLAASGGRITGKASAPAITVATITATDALGRSASDRFSIVAFESGLRAPALPAPSFRYVDAAAPLPPHFAATIGGVSIASMDNTPATNPTTDAGATLGRVLFYDPRLSVNDASSCSSCHRQSIGFADALPFSVGFGGALTPRHAPGLANARFYQRGRFFLDERAPTLEAQVLEPIQNAKEMGMSLDALALKLSVTSYYPSLFTAAFGTPAVTSDRIAAALAQFVRSLVSSDSRYDRAFDAAGVPNFASTLTAQEIQGEQLFRRSGCAACHVGVAQVGDAVHVTGLDAAPLDSGAGAGAFKAPSLRNVAVRTRFMHDGRFTTLDQVIDFYDSGVRPSPGLDARLKAPDGSPLRLRLTAAERAALVAFLGALTDSTFLSSPRFANPFAAPGEGPPPGVGVLIKGNQFTPADIVVGAGAVVSFTNVDNDSHSATFDQPAVAGTPVFTSGTKMVQMPTALGAYTYHCSIHAAMHGTVIVGK
ncbi:MAG TPA: cytochrome c peroxidase [Gemmatimonadaceae bacterium]|jgi:cytochrome c peroxidase|nr:cytochrome c peroxidase [Gemmatimonadaceae bacterium]